MKTLKSKIIALENLHLVISTLLILVIGLVYGISPNDTLPKLFGFIVENINLKNVFRSLMGLYIAMSSIWLMAIINKKLWVTATITNIAFMSGLAIGRIISLIFDGIPGIYFLLGLIGEIVLAVWGIVNLLHYKRKS
ncbi:DUF4345 domain-containing protein [Chitinophagaceae bacterium LWZ2-11]